MLVKELRLLDAAFDAGELRLIVGCCPNLQVFQYKTGDEAVTKKKASVAASKHVSKALLRVRNALQTLILDQRQRFNTYDEEEEGPIGNLRTFTALGRLEIARCDLSELKYDTVEEEP